MGQFETRQAYLAFYALIHYLAVLLNDSFAIQSEVLLAVYISIP